LIELTPSGTTQSEPIVARQKETAARCCDSRRLPAVSSGMKFELTVGTILLGILGSVAIPNLRTAMNRSKQKRSMADIRTIATAWEARATDFNRYGVGGSVPLDGVSKGVNWSAMPPVSYRDLAGALEPTYVKRLPEKDGWGTPFEFAAVEQSYAIRSAGRNRTADVAIYDSRQTTDFDSDLVYSNGSLFWFPEGI
jgi:type II secretory pathway pseudopilin PulG